MRELRGKYYTELGLSRLEPYSNEVMSDFIGCVFYRCVIDETIDHTKNVVIECAVVDSVDNSLLVSVFKNRKRLTPVHIVNERTYAGEIQTLTEFEIAYDLMLRRWVGEMLNPYRSGTISLKRDWWKGYSRWARWDDREHHLAIIKSLLRRSRFDKDPRFRDYVLSLVGRPYPPDEPFRDIDEDFITIVFSNDTFPIERVEEALRNAESNINLHWKINQILEQRLAQN